MSEEELEKTKKESLENEKIYINKTSDLENKGNNIEEEKKTLETKNKRIKEEENNDTNKKKKYFENIKKNHLLTDINIKIKIEEPNNIIN